MFNVNPQTQKKLDRFRKIKLGYYSFIVLSSILALLAAAELLVNSRALVVQYEDTLYFPTYSDFHPGTDFGLDYTYETNYRDLATHFKQTQSSNWVLMPMVPYNPYENDATNAIMRPEAPNSDRQHYLGTDTTSRDILARNLRAILCIGLQKVGCLIATSSMIHSH